MLWLLLKIGFYSSATVWGMQHCTLLLSTVIPLKMRFSIRFLAASSCHCLCICGWKFVDHGFIGNTETARNFKTVILSACSVETLLVSLRLQQRGIFRQILWSTNFRLWLYKKKSTFVWFPRARTLLLRQPGRRLFFPPILVYILVIHSVQYRWDLLYEKRDICVVREFVGQSYKHAYISSQ